MGLHEPGGVSQLLLKKQVVQQESIEKEKLPLANYYAMGHIHQRFETRVGNAVYVYPGPIFPNNFQELVDLKCGSFHMVEMDGSKIKTNSTLLPIKDVVFSELEITNGLTATEKIISEIDKLNIKDKIFLMKLKGALREGKSGDIRFNEIEDFVTKKGAYTFLRNISSLIVRETEMEIQTEHVEHIEERVFGEYSLKNPGEFNKFLPQLMSSLSIEKNEDEKEVIYEKRLMDDLKKIFGVEGILE